MRDDPGDALAAFWARLRPVLAETEAQAPARDHDAAFPQAELHSLAEAGLLTATLPVAQGGLGLGQPRQAAGLARLLYALGRASLPVARIAEAHINALQLIGLYGTAAQRRQAAAHAADGALYALWVTDPPQEAPLRLARDRLHGGKAFCSAAGFATHALLTAHTETGIRMLVVPTAGARRLEGRIALAGMRAAITGAMDFTDVPAGADTCLGAPGDYLREPAFSGGAWRGSAAALGGLAALLACVRTELRKRGRDADPHQRARFGRLAIAHEAARLWVAQAGARACDAGAAAGTVAYVNLARIAVETLCLEALQETQRALGLAAFIAGSAAERLGRDLAAYLRQPAPDATLDVAAAHYFSNPLPGEEPW